MLGYVRAYVWGIFCSDLHTFCSKLQVSALLSCVTIVVWLNFSLASATSRSHKPQATVNRMSSVNLCELCPLLKQTLNFGTRKTFLNSLPSLFLRLKWVEGWHESIAEICSAHWTVLTSFITLQLVAPFGLPCQSLCVRPWRKDMF